MSIRVVSLPIYNHSSKIEVLYTEIRKEMSLMSAQTIVQRSSQIFIHVAI